MLFEMPLLLGEGSARRDKIGGQFLFCGQGVLGTKLSQVFS